ncbi:holin [Bacillus sp. HMF5848]|nr:holin [Bacillus sp. HMF5848]
MGLGIKSTFSLAASFMTAMLGGWDMMLVILIMFVVIDYITGVLAAAVQGKLSSRAGFKGIVQKVMIFALVAVAHLLDLILSGNHNFIRDTVIFFYLFNELISIIENAGEVGLPIPGILMRAIEILRNKSSE